MEIRKCGLFPGESIPDPKPEEGGIHSSFELLFLMEGEFALEWLGMTYSSKEPCLFLIPGYTPHVLQGFSKNLKYFYVEFDLDRDEFAPALSVIIEWNGMQGEASGKRPDVQAALQSAAWLSGIMAWDQDGDIGPLREIAVLDILKILKLVAYIIATKNAGIPPKERKASSQQASIEALMRYLESNYREKITLGTLSRIAHLSESHLVRLFKQRTGKTPFQYLDELRQRAAVSYLENTKRTIQDIAAMTGFSSVHFFSRHFKQRHQVSPSLWRERHRAAETCAFGPDST